jgi:hypothetical protein
MKMQIKPAYIFVIVVSTFVIVPLITAITMIGSPAKERARKLDETRVNSLDTMHYSIDSYYTLNKKLPESLDALIKSGQFYPLGIQDPESGVPFHYETTSEKTYKLCATFTDESPKNGDFDYIYNRYGATPYGNATISWHHPKGYHCFDLTAIDNSIPQPLPGQPIK